MSNLKRSRVLTTLTVLALSALMAGCSSPGALPNNAGAKELGQAFSVCPGGAGEGASALETVAATTEWVAVAALNTDQRPAEGEDKTTDVTVSTVDGGEEKVRLHSSFWPGIEWALAHNATVWLAMADPELWIPNTVDYVMIVTEARQVFFPGDCLDEVLRVPLREALGTEANAVLAGLPEVAPGETRAYLGIEEPAEPEPDPDHTILNPDDVDASVLDPLTPIGVNITTTGAIGDGITFTICTRISAGWNDCIVADERGNQGWNISAYVDDTGELEFWLLDADANVSKPLGKLGQVSTGGKGIRVLVDTSGVTADGTIQSQDLVQLVK
ncbi:hypothetical protein [uncultured Microbacterium sp.]|uniref:Uncharacterized protein n=1 Tax=uncultured Microbacterium sp. TaxID=191216 RepID=A0A1Y5NZ40_9MICO|nr:hypothetical protein [uncultured Microbacterium sp.]SBS71712.1 exported hypothetical protein [uncultured Microbacterium sp.]